jgi:hypothetical protein
MKNPESVGGPGRPPQEEMELTPDVARAEESRAMEEALKGFVDAEHERVRAAGEVSQVERGNMLAKLAEFLTSTAGRNASKN